MLSDDKGQASAEFIFVTLIAIIVIGSLVSVIGSNQAETQSSNIAGAKIMGEKIAETVNTVYINGNGYSITMNLSTLNSGLNSTTYPFSFTATPSNITTNGTTMGVITVTSSATNMVINVIPTQFSGISTLKNSAVYNVTNVNGVIQIS
jgi:uncharacterized protein (UPF0333 family)